MKLNGVVKLAIDKFYESNAGKFIYKQLDKSYETSSITGNAFKLWYMTASEVQYEGQPLTKSPGISSFVAAQDKALAISIYTQYSNIASDSVLVPAVEKIGSKWVLAGRTNDSLRDANPSQAISSNYFYSLPRFGTAQQLADDGLPVYTEAQMERKLQEAINRSEVRGMVQAADRYESEIKNVDRQLKEMRRTAPSRPPSRAWSAPLMQRS